MRALVVTTVHHPEDARILHRQIRALREAGHEVTYAAPFHDYGVAVSAGPGLTVLDLPRASGWRRLGAALAARRLVARHAGSCDLVLLHDPELLVAVAGLRRPVTVWDVHEDTAAALTLKSWIPAPLRPLLRQLVRRLEHLAERRVELLLAEDGYRSRFRQPHPVVPNTTYVPELVHPPGTGRVVYLGALSTARGARDMISMARLLDGVARVELIGSAEGQTRTMLREAHDAGTLHWHGFLPNERALELLDGALAGLSLLHDEPNYRHSTPTKIVEYMAHGVPVITTPLPPAVALVEGYGTGLVVPFEDPAAAARAVRRLQSDRQLREGAARRGHAAAAAEFSWPVRGLDFVRTLEKLAAPARHRSRVPATRARSRCSGNPPPRQRAWSR